MNEPKSQTQRTLGLRAYLNLALAVTVVIFTLAGAFTYTQVESSIRADVEENLDSLAVHFAGDTIVTWLEQKRSLARALAAYTAMREMQVEEAQRIINATYAAAPADYNNIGFFDATGLMVADIAGGAGKGNLIKGNPWGQEVYDGQRTQSPELISSLNNRPIFVLYERVRDASGAVVGVVGVGTDLTAIGARLEELKIGQTGEAILVNSQGLVLNRLRHEPDSILTLDLSKDRLTQLALSGQAGIVEVSDYRGVPVVAAYRPILEYGWGVVVKQDADEAFAVLARLRAVFFGVMVAALAVALASNLIIQRRVSLALGRLIAGSQRFATGELATPIEPLAIGEFGHLAEEFNRMATDLAAKEAQLRGYAEQLEQKVRERTAQLEAAKGDLEKEIAGHNLAEEALRAALEESHQRGVETSALLEGSRAVLKYRGFNDAARSIFDSCKNLIGATAGYVALLSEDGTENLVLFLESGGLACRVDPSLPMPIRGLRGEVYRTGQAMYHNDFPSSEWVDFLPEGHVRLDNALFAPLIIAGKAVGLLGIANKPGSFTDNDIHLSEGFAELAAIALLNSQTLESLEHSEERFRAVAQSASDAIISADSQGVIVFWNNAAQAIFGWPADEIIGKPVTEIMPEHYRADHQAGMQRLITTGEARVIGRTVELAGLRRDGSEIPIELSLASWRMREDIFFTVIIRDITERKQAEEVLEAANKELEAFSYSVSHDLRAPLRAIDGFSRILLDKYTKQLPSEAQRYQRLVRDNTKQMGHLIDDLLTFSRLSRQSLKLQPVSTDELVRQALQDLQSEQEGRRIEISVAKLPPCHADPALLKQVWVNLLSNALKFTAKREMAKIEIGYDPHSPPLPGGRGAGGEGGVYFVRDNGVGFDMQYVHKLFGVFQRLHRAEEYEGTGVGLAIVHRIIHRHGGRVWAEANPNNGATFYFALGQNAE